MTSARAAVLDAPRTQVRVENLTFLDLRPNEVLVRVTATGLCHSDLLTLDGTRPPPAWPLVLGHEGTGVVMETGTAVEALRSGDRVISTFAPVCGRCWWCVRGETHLCMNPERTRPVARAQRENGSDVYRFAALGTFAEQMLVSEESLVKVETDLPAEQLALLGCGVTTGVCAALRTAGVVPGSSIAVLGLGGVGQAAIQGARIAGASTIVGIDPVAMKRSLAESLGATHTLDPSSTDVVAETRSLTGGRGVDYAFETSGRIDAVAAAYELVRRGGALVPIGVHPKDVSPPWKLTDQILSGKRVLGSLYGSAQVRRDIPLLVELAEVGRLDLDALVSRRITLDQVNEGLAAIESGEVIRSVIVN
jgi:S-(hydroxymethyl)glutathione dehydrogenase / alcohol dehydrogenase